METPIFTVDIGNTRTKFCVWDTQNELFPIFEFSDSSYFFESTEDWIQRLPFSNERVMTWLISSVNRNKSVSLREVINRTRPLDSVNFVKLSDVPIKVRYDYPEKLGIDRVVAAYAGLQVLGTGRPFLVVDVGTAATIDYVDSKGLFCGGAILPGARLAAEALQAKTASLPMIEDPENEKALNANSFDIRQLFHYPATETQAAIRVGVMFSLIGAITAFYWRITSNLLSKQNTTNNLTILLAGGDAQLTMLNLQCYFEDLFLSADCKLSRPEIIMEPRLLQKGLRDMALTNCSKYAKS